MNAELPPGAPAAAVVDLDAVRHNVEVLRERAGQARVMAVVKADAYGHGLLPCAHAAVAGGAAWLGVARLSEALALRRAGFEVPVLAWLTVPGDAFEASVRAGVDIGVGAGWALDEVAAAAGVTGTPGRVHLKIDTGMNRNGINGDEWPDLVDRALKLQAAGLVEVVGVFSHFARADEPSHPSVAAQTAAFREAVELAERRGARFEVRHLANSAATLTDADARFDVVRPGLSVFGLSPLPRADSRSLGLRPAMTLLARVANVKRVAAGEGVSYGHTYRTDTPTTLALLPLGYADGLPWAAANSGPVGLGGRIHRVSGRVCMDQVVLDLHDPEAAVAAGDVAVVFGGGPGEPTADDWARAAGTISHEIVTGIGTRVPRLYVGGATVGVEMSERRDV